MIASERARARSYQRRKLNLNENHFLGNIHVTKRSIREIDRCEKNVSSFLRLFLRMQNGSYGRGGDFIVNYYLKPSFLHSFSRSSVNKRPLTDGWQTYM